MTIVAKFSSLAALGLLVSACSGGSSGTTTSAILGPDGASQLSADQAVQSSTPNERAAQVGAVAARAQKCGYNFDAAKLKANFLAAEARGGTAPDQLPAIEKAYDLAGATVVKAVASLPEYCTESRTKVIKADLNRHLAGDFSAPPKKIAQAAPKKDDSGFFGGLFESKCDSCDQKLDAATAWDPATNSLKRQR